MISVVICAHNSRTEYLSRTLAALKAQTLPVSEWELVVVDSASSVPLATTVDVAWHPRGRHVREDQAGLTRARLRAIRETTSELIVFVDDDNVLDAGFLSEAARLSRDWPTLGAWSGHTRPEFEKTPPEWTRRYWGNLVIRQVDHDAWSNLPLLPETMPCGAGLCVRREVASHYAHLHASGKRPIMLDRVGGGLLSGGDNDLAACSCQLGLGVGVFASMRLTHLIPANRLEEDYLVSLVEGIALSGIVLRSLHGDAAVAEAPTTKTRIADMIRLLLMNRRERRFFRASRRGASRGRAYLRSGTTPS